MSLLSIYIISDDIPANHPEFKKKWIKTSLSMFLEVPRRKISCINVCRLERHIGQFPACLSLIVVVVQENLIPRFLSY